MAIKLEMLRCFRAVARHGSLAEAASALGRTPSAVSMMLSQFEEHLGAPLFEAQRKSRLSQLGQQVEALVIRQLDSFDGTLETIEALARADMGLVRLSVTPSLAQTILPGALGRFRARHPDVELHLTDTDTTGVHADMRSGQADLGLASSGAIAGFPAQRLFSDSFGVICRRDHPLARDWGRLTWADLSSDGFISNGLCDQIDDPDFARVRDGARYHVRNTASLLGIVQAGLGYTLLPERALPADIEALAFLPLKDSEARRDVWLITQPEHLVSPAARAMADCIREEVSELQVR
ncbi:LysR family transcriptional regulator [Rhodobacteraceae bacterium 63075]|nr:LysR family transcriptional regulator [Rhodobacteraceae bacterium 63075]